MCIIAAREVFPDSQNSCSMVDYIELIGRISLSVSMRQLHYVSPDKLQIMVWRHPMLSKINTRQSS